MFFFRRTFGVTGGVVCGAVTHYFLECYLNVMCPDPETFLALEEIIIPALFGGAVVLCGDIGLTRHFDNRKENFDSACQKIMAFQNEMARLGIKSNPKELDVYANRLLLHISEFKKHLYRKKDRKERNDLLTQTETALVSLKQNTTNSVKVVKYKNTLTQLTKKLFPLLNQCVDERVPLSPANNKRKFTV